MLCLKWHLCLQVPTTHQRRQPLHPALSQLSPGPTSPVQQPDPRLGRVSGITPSLQSSTDLAHSGTHPSLSSPFTSTHTSDPHTAASSTGSIHQTLHTLSQIAESLHSAPLPYSSTPSIGQESHHQQQQQQQHHHPQLAHSLHQHQSYETFMLLLQTLPQSPDAYQPPSNFPIVLMALYRLHDSLASGPSSDSSSLSSSTSSTSTHSGPSSWESTSYPWSELIQTGLSLYALKAPFHAGSFTNSMLDTLLEQCVSRDAPAFAATLWKRVAAAVPLYKSLQVR